jgi:DnaK suppressor protein
MPNKKRTRVDPKRRKRKSQHGKEKSIRKSAWTTRQNPTREESDFRRGMNRQLIARLAHDLSHRRSLLLQDVAESQDEMKAILEEQESEFEESAQKDRITRLVSRLNERDRQKIREIEAALNRMTAGRYGKCEKCGREIGIDRLRALPTATLCIDCAAARESKSRASGVEEPSEHFPMRDREAEEFDQE